MKYNRREINVFQHVKVTIVSHQAVDVVSKSTVNKFVIVRILFFIKPSIHILIAQPLFFPYLISQFNRFLGIKASQRVS